MAKAKEVEQDLESLRVLEWRVAWLRAGGYTKRNANRIASTTVDWRHANRVLKDAQAKGYDQDFVMELIL